MNLPEIKSKWVLAAIIICSVGIRIAAAIYLGDEIVNLPGTYDQVSYHNLAIRVIDGHGFSFGTDWWPFTAAGAPTAHWSYIYTIYLYIVYKVFGPHPLAARLIQAVIVGVLHPMLAYLIGKRIFNETTGLIAAGITAIYIYFIYYAGSLMTEPYYITAILASLYFSIRLIGARSPTVQSGDRISLSIALGLALGLAILLRQLFILVTPFLFLWIWWVRLRNGLTHTLRPIWIASLITILFILPFSVYNYTRFNRFVLLNTNAGFAFFWGNHPIYGTKFIPILPAEMGSYQELIPEDVRHLDEAAMDQELLKRSLQIIFEGPERYLLLSLSRITPYFIFWPTYESGLLSNISRVGSFGLFLPFMLYGLVLSLFMLPKGWGKFLSDPKMLLYGFMAGYTLIHLLSWTLIRYRLPVDAVLVIFAGVAIVDLATRIGTKRNRANHFGFTQQL